MMCMMGHDYFRGTQDMLNYCYDYEK